MGQFQREDHAGERGPHDAAEHAGQPDQSPEPGPTAGKTCASRVPERAADHEHRRQHPAGGAGAERERPDQRLHDQDADDQPEPDRSVELGADDVVADAERLRNDQAADADDQAADGRPPHPVHGQPPERVLGGVDQHGRDQGQQPGGDARTRCTARTWRS